MVSSSDTSTIIYVDGQLKGTIPASVELYVESIGNLLDGSGMFSPKLDDFLVYDRSLSSEKRQVNSMDQGMETLAFIHTRTFLLPLIMCPRSFHQLVLWYTGLSMT